MIDYKSAHDQLETAKDKRFDALARRDSDVMTPPKATVDAAEKRFNDAATELAKAVAKTKAEAISISK